MLQILQLSICKFSRRLVPYFLQVQALPNIPQTLYIFKTGISSAIMEDQMPLTEVTALTIATVLE